MYSTPSPHPTPAALCNVIETARLCLRELTPGDAKFMLRLLNEDGFVQYIGDKGVRSLADARQYIAEGPMDSYRRCGFGLYLTTLRTDGAPIGICGLVKRDTLRDADVGFALLSQFWSQGYASEAAAAVLEYGRSKLQMARIVAVTAVGNTRSIAVLTKIGLRFERRIKLAPDGPELNLYAPATSTTPSPAND